MSMSMQKNILEYLEQTAPSFPDKIAFSTGKESMTFSEVFSGARAVGSFLSHRGFYGEPIAVLMDKHPTTVTAFFGIIYAGCFYVCIDEKSPRTRIEQILSKLSPRAIVCDEKNRKLAQNLGVENVFEYSEMSGEAIDTAALADIRRRQINTDAIYVVFTSGSTGVPKGVVACHRSVIDYTETLCEALQFSAENVFANQTPLYFDAPLKEIMPTLKLGATTYFVPKMLFSFPIRLIDYLDEYKINTICWVVSALVQISSLGALSSRVPKYITTVAFGSELFPRKDYDMWRAALPKASFYNLYGPTEATGMSCYWHAERELAADEPIPIGRAFDNTDIILLDECGNAADEGEICIRGTCLTLGYYEDAARTADVFVQNPLRPAYPERIYRTGDIGKRNQYGELVFICRKDSQIKHMGHRIELGEIEAAAVGVPSVGRACCVYDREGKRIALYYVGELSERELAAALLGIIPRYMQPAIIERLDVMPTTANGKTDRKGLSDRAKDHK